MDGTPWENHNANNVRFPNTNRPIPKEFNHGRGEDMSKLYVCDGVCVHRVRMLEEDEKEFFFSQEDGGNTSYLSIPMILTNKQTTCVRGDGGG